MKSIIHEASSIAKAIEQGWVKAGKPKDFSVKIFEEPVKNFIGMTTKNAKVGIFIEDGQHQRDQRSKKHAPARRKHHRQDGQWRRQQPYGQDRQAQDSRTQGRPPQQGQERQDRDDRRQQRPPRPQEQRPYQRPDQQQGQRQEQQREQRYEDRTPRNDDDTQE